MCVCVCVARGTRGGHNKKLEIATQMPSPHGVADGVGDDALRAGPEHRLGFKHHRPVQTDDAPRLLPAQGQVLPRSFSEAAVGLGRRRQVPAGCENIQKHMET